MEINKKLALCAFVCISGGLFASEPTSDDLLTRAAEFTQGVNAEQKFRNSPLDEQIAVEMELFEALQESELPENSSTVLQAGMEVEYAQDIQNDADVLIKKIKWQKYSSRFR
ncbi:hypothetical protein H0X06_01390 [Candidatus Dependentiae bacterium]|nr:hypothetical protein [Candidatus Dependentiae bacterium]